MRTHLAILTALGLAIAFVVGRAGCQEATALDAALDYSGVGACGANTWVSTLNADAAGTCTQPAFTNVSGSISAAQCPDASASQEGCVTTGTQTFAGTKTFQADAYVYTGTDGTQDFGAGTVDPDDWLSINSPGGTNLQVKATGTARLIVVGGAGGAAELHLVDGDASANDRAWRIWNSGGTLEMGQPADDYSSQVVGLSINTSGDVTANNSLALTSTTGGVMLPAASGAASNPAANYVRIYVREDIDLGAGTGTADCGLRARLASGTEVTVVVLVTDGGC